MAQLYGQYMPPEVKQVLGEWQGRLEYLFLPFLFSSEKTVNWADMRLDSFGARVGRVISH